MAGDWDTMDAVFNPATSDSELDDETTYGHNAAPVCAPISIPPHLV